MDRDLLSMADDGATAPGGSAFMATADLASLEPVYDAHASPAYPLLIEPEEEVRVLIIEDDAAVSEMYRIKLELDGYTVVVASDGEQGLALASEHPTAIVFLDIRLPKMDGFAVLESLRANDTTRNTPVIILSNYDQAEQIERGFELGALDYLVKAETTPSMLASGLGKWING